MSITRRWYIYLVCAFSLQAITWASITLLRNLLGSSSEVSIAFKIAILLVGMPIFLAHWLWAQRLATAETEERHSALRRFYLYGMMSAMLGPFIANAFDLLAFLLFTLFGGHPDSTRYNLSSGIGYHLAALVVLGAIWFYHWLVKLDDEQAASHPAGSIPRLYIYGFGAAGLTMATMSVIHLIRWLLFNIGSQAVIFRADLAGLTDEVARALVGFSLWGFFWRQAQNRLASKSTGEVESALRKFYLYAVVFISVLTTVTNATTILAGGFRRLLSLPAQGDIRIPLPTIIGMALLWGFHALALKEDAAAAQEAPRQAGIRRIYLYLVSGIGLAAFLVGLSGDISLLIRAEFASAQKEALAWFTAALLAGLPVWLLPWSEAQNNIASAAGIEDRRSLVRKIYLYFYLFFATMTALSSLVYIVYQLLLIVLGETTSVGLLAKLGQAIAFTLISSGVWVFHNSLLRHDASQNLQDKLKRLAQTQITLVAMPGSEFAQTIAATLKQEYPGLQFDLLDLTEENAAQTGHAENLLRANIIVAPWLAAIPGKDIAPEITQAFIHSPAKKLIIPSRTAEWEWVGVERWNEGALTQQTVAAVKQILENEEVQIARPLGIGAIIGIIIGVLLALMLVVIPLLAFFENL